MTFEYNDRQIIALKMLGGPATHNMLRGGSRSGKTFLLTTAMTTRALKAPETRHAMFRFRFNHIKQSVIFDTFPKVMALRFPGVKYRLNQTDWFAEFFNGSRIVFGGLDDKERTEKILGTEYSTIYLNECSQISYDARNKVITRLAQKSSLKLKAYYDCNPPKKSHWTYRMFEQKVEPKSGEAFARPELYASMMLNPDANRANLAEEYIAQLEALPEADRRRFLLGEYLAQVDNALWTIESFARLSEAQVPRLRRIVIAVDPSGCSGPEDTRSDEVGIAVAGIDYEGRGYMLADLSGRYAPHEWANVALHAFDTYEADIILAERNFGGAMVESTIRSVRKTAPVRLITASRGKTVRAEPVAALYDQGRVFHVGNFPDMEDQFCSFARHGYEGAKSPDRADAAVYAISELMLGAPGGATYSFG